METQSFQYPTRNGIAYGAIGGFIAGIAMMLVAMYTSIMAGMPSDIMMRALGNIFVADNTIDGPKVGMAMHLATSIMVGIIFGAIVSKIQFFKITNYKKGILEGLATGGIALVVISLPLAMFVLPPILGELISKMNPDVTKEMAIQNLKQNIASNMAAAALRHVVYGLVLGAITTSFVMRHKRFFA